MLDFVHSFRPSSIMPVNVLLVGYGAVGFVCKCKGITLEIVSETVLDAYALEKSGVKVTVVARSNYQAACG